ncbi:MAG: polysaccharide deacetylase family protein [Hyphomicrobiaceae bacterium]
MKVRTITGICLAMCLVSTSTVAADCPNNPNAIGVSRVVQIDTTGGPGFGLAQYKMHDFLQDKEVILTFDDGPQARLTDRVLAALARHCTKATFFSIGKMALGLPQIIRRVHEAGHTVGSHTWSHKNLGSRKSKAIAIDEIEKGISAVSRAVGQPIAPFFRYPFLRDSDETLDYFRKRNIGVFSMDVDSFDFKYRRPRKLANKVVAKLNRAGKGILLMHDIQPVTAKALPIILDKLKSEGFKIVHMTPAFPGTSLPKYDKAIEKNVRGLGQPGAGRPTSSVVKTISSQ